MMMTPLDEYLRDCRLCPRECRVNRLEGERGTCRLTDHLLLDCALPHHGEEPPLSGTGGSGTIFFSSCNLRCLFCQNYQISHTLTGRVVSPVELASLMLSLAQGGCHNINLVTPSPQIVHIFRGLMLARNQGLTCPIVYNTSGYERVAVLRHLDGWVDIYLPDMKFGSEDVAYAMTGTRDYVVHTVAALEEMARQVGEHLLTHQGIATHGLLIRHLVLPGMAENSLKVLDLIAQHLSTSVALSLMSQYTPIPKVASHPLLRRRITKGEYTRVVDYALDKGFEQIYIQDVDDRHLVPDFDQKPFKWEDD